MINACKNCRREGDKLFLKGERCSTPKCAMTKRPYIPGQHGPGRRGKASEYAKQLRAKQRLKSIFGLSESVLAKYFLEADRKSGNTADNLVSILQSRADNILYTSGMVDSRSTSRQMISHGRLTLNGKRILTPSILLKVGDMLNFSKLDIKELPKPADISWLKVNASKKEIEVVHLPTRDEVDLNVDENLVLEYYSR